MYAINPTCQHKFNIKPTANPTHSVNFIFRTQIRMVPENGTGKRASSPYDQLHWIWINLNVLPAPRSMQSTSHSEYHNRLIISCAVRIAEYLNENQTIDTNNSILLGFYLPATIQQIFFGSVSFQFMSLLPLLFDSSLQMLIANHQAMLCKLCTQSNTNVRENGTMRCHAITSHNIIAFESIMNFELRF